MSNILISTIVRNRGETLRGWHDQLESLVCLDEHNQYYLSIYENDSEDNSVALLNSFDYSFCKDYCLKSETLNTKYYYPPFEDYGTEQGHFSKVDRVNNLAAARNKSIFECGFLGDTDYVLCIEPDIKYSPQESLPSVINKQHYDIISAKSIFTSTRYESHPLYDGWATRKTEHEESWDFSISLEGMIPVWSTFNCFCMYKSLPFKQGAAFGGFNKRLDKPDCDTAVICEEFRALGYHNMVMNCEFEVLQELE